MRKLVSFMHISLDGFAAGPNGEMGWIKLDEDLFDYAGNQTACSDMGIYGRVTYELMEAYWPTAADKPKASKHDKEHAEWYNRVQKVVVSTTMRGVEKDKTTIISDDIANRVAVLKQMEGEEITMFGSPGLSHTLMHHDLIDEYWLFINPILLGEGIPFFKDINQHTKLKLVENTAFKCGVVCLHYVKE
ncbi:MAG: dihydrofolate reductase family protein [Bacteroidota bacterium]